MDLFRDSELLERVLEFHDQKYVAEYLGAISPGNWCRETINRWSKGKASPCLTAHEYDSLYKLLPSRPTHYDNPKFTFIDLFAGIGGLRKGFDAIGGKCVFTSEWNPFAQKTYKANYWCDPEEHVFNGDIRSITLSNREDIPEDVAYRHIEDKVPDHDVLLAGFPCQPFSIAGVSKKNALGRAHGFECKTQGTLFFDVARIIRAKRPAAFLLENVKNLRSHDKGRTFQVIMETLDELGYAIADADAPRGQDPKIIDARHFLPQHRERIVLVGFRKDLGLHHGFTLKDLDQHKPREVISLGQLLEKNPDPGYILTPKLWEYLFNYAEKHRRKGNGFGFGLVDENSVTRTLSARYYKDGSEILVDRGWNFALPFDHPFNRERVPRRLTPRECARLMGFDLPGKDSFKIPVSDTQAYKQFGNSVVVPVFTSVAQLMAPRLARIQAAEGGVSLVA